MKEDTSLRSSSRADLDRNKRSETICCVSSFQATEGWAYVVLSTFEKTISLICPHERDGPVSAYNTFQKGDSMNNKELEAVMKLPANKRYEYFIKKVVDFEEVWGLYNDGWAMTQDNTGEMLIPFWPSKEFAELCSIDEWSDFAPESIELEEFINDWLPGIQDDGYKVSVFWNNDDSAVLEVDTLLKDLEKELEKY